MSEPVRGDTTMTDDELMRLLKAAHRVEVNEIQTWLTQERASCLSLPRARQLALNPQAATPPEEAQLASCRHCARLVEQLQASLIHPPSGSLSAGWPDCWKVTRPA